MSNLYQKLYDQILDSLEEISTFYDGDLKGLDQSYNDIEYIAEKCQELLNQINIQTDKIENSYDPREEALTPQERNPGFRRW